MGIRQFKPVTKSSRFRSVSDFTEITRSTPEKSLTEPLKRSGGRDNHGHISMRRIGGGHKRKYRIIDFKRNKFGVPASWPWSYGRFAEEMAKPKLEAFERVA